MAAQIIFTGQIPSAAVREQYLRADIFVLNSKNEGCPNTVLEAMSYGLPVVATRVGGVTEIIETGKSGVIVPTEHPAVLPAALRELMLDKVQRTALGQAAFERVRTRFSITKQLAELQSILFNRV